MSANRIQYFIRSVLQNSKLNREKFVNKKKYIMSSIKNRNHNIVIKRKYSTTNRFSRANFNGPNKKPNSFLIGCFVGYTATVVYYIIS